MKNYRFVFPYRVNVTDIDYRGSVSEAAVLNFFQEARIGFLAQLGQFRELDIGEGCGIIQHEASLRFFDRISLGDELKIGVRVLEVRRIDFTLEYRIQREEDILAEGKTKMISFDYSNRKARRLPEKIKSKLSDYAGAL